MTINTDFAINSQLFTVPLENTLESTVTSFHVLVRLLLNQRFLNPNDNDDDAADDNDSEGYDNDDDHDNEDDNDNDDDNNNDNDNDDDNNNDDDNDDDNDNDNDDDDDDNDDNDDSEGGRILKEPSPSLFIANFNISPYQPLVI